MNTQQRKLRAKSVFWWSFGLCYFALFALTLLATRNWRSDYINGGTFGVLNAFVSYIVATIVCRKRGVSLEEQKTTKLFRAASTEDSQNHLEMRSLPMDKTTMQCGVLGGLFMASILAAVFFGIPTKQQEGRAIGFVFVAAFLFGAFYIYKKRDATSLLVEADNQQISANNQWGIRKTVKWSEIARCEMSEGKYVLGQEYLLVLFYSKFNTSLLTVTLLAATPEERTSFKQFLLQRFTPEN